MKKTIIFNALGLLLIACGPKISKEQAEKLDQLSIDVDASVNLLMNEIDSNRLMDLTNGFFNRRHFFQNELKDTIDTKTVFIIDDYLRGRKGMEYIQMNFAPIIKEAKTMQSQIRDLKHDVENRLVDQEQFEKYYNLERNNFMELEKAAKQIHMIYLRIDTQLVQKNIKIDSIINSYKIKMDA